MLTIEDADLDRELTKSVARLSQFADNFWMGFRDGRGEEGRFPIVPGTFARKLTSGEIEATPLGDAYLGLDGALNRLETTLDALPDQPLEVENILRRIRQLRFDLQFIVAGDDKHFVYWMERRGRG